MNHRLRSIGNGVFALHAPQRLLALVVTVALAGCAAQTAFREGQSLMAQGKPAQGVAKLQEANRLEPGSAAYRIGYLQARDSYGQALIERGDAARAQSRYDEAEAAYREALALRSHQDRALSGLQLIDRQRRREGVLKEAEEAVARKDWDTARGKLRLVLMEAPQDAAARKLLQQIEPQEAHTRSGTTVLTEAYRRPISIEFKDVPLRTVFEVVARTSVLNFLFDKEVRTDQRTSIYLRNSTVEAAVSWLLLTNQLEQRVLDGNTVLIYPANPAKQQEYKPLLVKSFYLASADAKRVAETLKTLLKSKDVVVDEKLNLVIMRDSPEAIRLAEKIVSLHDVHQAEVMLDVEVLEVTRERLLDLGVAWPTQVGLSVLPSVTGGTLTLSDLRQANAGTIGVSVGSATVNAQKQDGDTNLLANPRIRARNRESAKILIGNRVPNVTTTLTSNGFASESVTYLDVGLKLEVEPTIFLDNEVAIKISLEVSNIVSQQTTKNGSLIYQIGTRNAQTVLRLKDGENQVLAGLINDEERRTANKVPGLGEFPIVGRLFGQQADSTTKTEVVLSITPRILRNLQPPGADTLEFESGTESNLRVWPVFTGSGQTVGTGQAAGSDEGARSVAAKGQSATMPAAVPATDPSVSAPTPSAVAKPEAMPQLRWVGPAQAKAGETFTAQLMLQSEQPLLGAPLVLEFDPKVLQVVSVSEGSFLKDGGVATTFKARVDPSGQIVIAADRQGTQAGASTPGMLASLVLKVLSTAAATATNLQVSRFAPTTVAGHALVVGPPAPLVLTVTR